MTMQPVLLDLLLMLAFILVGAVPGYLAKQREKKLRRDLAGALSETTKQQVHTIKQFGDMMCQMQKQQQLYTQHLQALTDAHQRLRDEVQMLAHQMDALDGEDESLADAPDAPLDLDRAEADLESEPQRQAASGRTVH